ncbi:MAG: cobalamin B12-binding domain-containing protein [Woeseiaceae bacterium]|jgi:methanogenic corrinoid protein MtbC1|nr:cobalamin B12-binding domain-containing protein [Woeseiaceae bacterium]
MTRENPDQLKSDTAQGKIQEFDSPSNSETNSAGELGDFSLKMLTQLGRTIENELIPRLMLAFDSTPASTAAPAANRLSEHVDTFVQLVIENEADVAARYVDTLRAEGFPIATLYLDLLAPAARRLGDMWDTDDVSFADVTIGVCRMHQVLLEFTRCFDATTKNGDDSQTALIAPAPGEQHTFGLFMVMEFLRREGWTCYSGTPSTRKEFLKLANSADFRLIGLSISADRNLQEAGQLIKDLRRRTDAKILVGGRCVLESPKLVDELGADAMARDGREAARVINKLIREARSHQTP